MGLLRVPGTRVLTTLGLKEHCLCPLVPTLKSLVGKCSPKSATRGQRCPETLAREVGVLTWDPAPGENLLNLIIYSTCLLRSYDSS